MIWFFLMGMIAGAVGVIMMLRWWFKTHVEKISTDEILREIAKDRKDEEESHD